MKKLNFNVFNNVEKMVRKLTTEEFIQLAKLIHRNRYNYSKVNYISNKIKIIIICLKHGDFEQASKNHVLQKQGCPT